MGNDRKQQKATESNRKQQGIKLLCYRYNITGLELPHNMRWWTWRKVMESDGKWWKVTGDNRRQRCIKLLCYRHSITNLKLPNNIRRWNMTESDGKRQEMTGDDRRWQGVKLLRYRHNITRLKLPDTVLLTWIFVWYACVYILCEMAQSAQGGGKYR